jgi:hypothetical protein
VQQWWARHSAFVHVCCTLEKPDKCLEGPCRMMVRDHVTISSLPTTHSFLICCASKACPFLLLWYNPPQPNEMPMRPTHLQMTSGSVRARHTSRNSAAVENSRTWSSLSAWRLSRATPSTHRLSRPIRWHTVRTKARAGVPSSSCRMIELPNKESICISKVEEELSGGWEDGAISAWHGGTHQSMCRVACPLLLGLVVPRHCQAAGHYGVTYP